MTPPPETASTDAADPIRLELDDGRTVTGAESANAELAAFGTRVSPIDLTAAPGDVRALLARPKLGHDEAAVVRDAFLLSREQALEAIAAASRTPAVEGGGALETRNVADDVAYPQLYVVDPEVDYSRFDVLHLNSADDGTTLDELVSVVSGGGFVLTQQLPDGRRSTLTVHSEDTTGWRVSYGGHPHIGSISDAEPGSKLVVQAIGPPSWQARPVAAG
jgi:hypothetical protein